MFLYIKIQNFKQYYSILLITESCFKILNNLIVITKSMNVNFSYEKDLSQLN